MGRALARVVATFREHDRRLSVVSMNTDVIPTCRITVAKPHGMSRKTARMHPC
eukprot:COSAG03_NODE_1896_length_3379_cov_29.807012_4_plen_53_part_00